jgi:hypothetical protein
MTQKMLYRPEIMTKPKKLYRQEVVIWSDYPIDEQQLSALAERTPDCYWVFGEEQVVENQEEFPNTAFFDVEQ